jgi:hypothetical protein
MKKFTIEVLAALAAAGIAGAAFAGGKGGAGAGVGAAAGVGANAGVNAGANAAGGNAGAHVSPQGSANSNGQFQTGRQFGLDRAQERMSEEGLEHQKATTAPAERKGPKANAETSGSSRARTETR